MQDLARKSLFARIWKQKDDEPAAASADYGSILIADDSRTVVHALKLILERAGYEIVTAGDGAQAVDRARTHQPDLILMDIVMPVMNGFEAMRALKNAPATAAIPVVCISGEQQSDRAWGARLGVKGFLSKPISKEQLLLMVRFVLAQARKERDLAARERSASGSIAGGSRDDT